MSEENDGIVRRFEQAFADNDTATIDELCHPDLVDHNPAPGQEPNLTGFKETIAYYKSIFPDSETQMHAVFGEGDLVASHWTVRGTHQGEFFGIPATGKHVEVEGMNVYRLADGKITDVWTQFDAVGMLQQLGAMPASP